MNTESHTPGPWQIDVRNFGFVKAAGADKGIAMTIGVGSDQEVLANQRLIASSPELLGALKACVALLSELDVSLDSVITFEEHIEIQHAIELSNGVINKATSP